MFSHVLIAFDRLGLNVRKTVAFKSSSKVCVFTAVLIGSWVSEILREITERSGIEHPSLSGSAHPRAGDSGESERLRTSRS
jgi:hypothetical protein